MAYIGDGALRWWIPKCISSFCFLWPYTGLTRVNLALDGHPWLWVKVVFYNRSKPGRLYWFEDCLIAQYESFTKACLLIVWFVKLFQTSVGLNWQQTEAKALWIGQSISTASQLWVHIPSLQPSALSLAFTVSSLQMGSYGNFADSSWELPIMLAIWCFYDTL